MKYVFLENNIVTDQAKVDPHTIFYPEYASRFIEAPDEVTFGWKMVDQKWIPPIVSSDEEIKGYNKSHAEQLLRDTDWVEVPSVSDTTRIPHLANYEEFMTYRLALRAIAVTPLVVVIEWPVLPTENWVTE